MISVLIFNSDGNKIIVGKRPEEGTWGIFSKKLEYGENFEGCVSLILCNKANILVEDPNRVKFICSHNAVDKENNNHIVSVNYYIQVTKEEEKFGVMVDPGFFQSWNWFSFEEILKMYDNLYYGLKVFLNKFGIRNFEDIKNLVSN
jgi:ADP-ribose pyrophosphatase YjhB (NUDIX family)